MVALIDGSVHSHSIKDRFRRGLGFLKKKRDICYNTNKKLCHAIFILVLNLKLHTPRGNVIRE